MDVWLNDFSSVVGTFWNSELEREGFEVEVFSPRRKVFTAYPEATHFYPMLADSKGRVFIRDQNDMRTIERCEIDIDNETMSCTEVLDINGNAESLDSATCPECPLSPVPTGRYINRIALFSDDKTMLFTAEGDTCARFIRIGEEETGCFTTSRYETVSDVVISPDERWVAFVEDRRTGPGPFKTLQNYTDDLYVVRVKKY